MSTRGSVLNSAHGPRGSGPAFVFSPAGAQPLQLHPLPAPVPERAALLSGEHPTLPEAELEALLAVHAPGARLRVEGRLAWVSGPDGVDDALRRLVLARTWGEPWGEGDDTPEGHDASAHTVADAAAAAARAHGLVGASAAVRTQRAGSEKSGHAIAVARRIGQALSDAGHPIDLTAPELEVYAWLLDGRVHAGRLLGTVDRSRFEARISERRAHFSPVTLHPRRAASLLHLARVPPGGRVHDPFCGTGTFVLEAALEGYQASGSDLDERMAQGTLQALADDGPEPVDAEVFVADAAEVPERIGPVDGVVADLPYGRASGTRREPVEDLYARALAAVRKLLRPGGRAVLGTAVDLSPAAEAAGLEVVEEHTEFVHRSLTRHYLVARRPPRGD